MYITAFKNKEQQKTPGNMIYSRINGKNRNQLHKGSY